LLSFHLKPLISLLATPKRQRGRKAQQARTVAAATAATATTTIDTTTATATTTVATIATTTPAAATPPATTAATIFASPTRGTVTMQAAMAITITGTSLVEDSDDPFLMPSPIHLYESSPANQPDVNNTSEASAEHRRDSKAGQDVATFFQQENTRWYCKFCEYVLLFVYNTCFSNI